MSGPDWIKQISVNLTIEEVDAIDEMIPELMTEWERTERKRITRSEAVRRLIHRRIAKKKWGVQ